MKGYTVTQNKQYHTEAATSIGEAIKILSKIHALGETIEFDEFARHNERLPYSDMLPNARYTTYVLYAHERGLLDGIGSRKVFGRGELKALTPISKKQVKQLLDNFGADPKQYPELDGSGRFVSRDLFASIVVDAFRDKMPDYRYLYGQNTLFYRWLIARLQSKPLAEHEAYVRQMIDGLKLRDVDMM